MSDLIIAPIASSRTPENESLTRNIVFRNGLFDSPTLNVRNDSAEMLGKLSVALKNMRHLKEQLASKEEELVILKEEKEKRADDSSKLYSQITAIRTRCTILENQCVKKNEETFKIQEKYEALELECSKLRKIISEDTSKQTGRIKSLEQQIVTLKDELASAKKLEETIIESESDKNLLNDNIKELHQKHILQMEEVLNENNRLINETADLTNKLENARSNNIKLSSEKASLKQELDCFCKEFQKIQQNKDLAIHADFEECFAELEAERANAKNAVKKAMAVLDDVDELSQKLEDRERTILELENNLKLYQNQMIRLPGIESLGLNFSYPEVKTKNEIQITFSPESQPEVLTEKPNGKSVEESLGELSNIRSRLNKLLGRIR